MKFMISPSKVARALFLITLSLVCANITGQYALYTFGKKYLHQCHLLSLINQFDLGRGGNIPDWYESATLLLCALLLAAIAFLKQRRGESFLIRWWLLALLFLGLSVDEATEAHQALVHVLQTALDATGLNNFAWEIPIAVCALLLALMYARFLAALPRRTRVLFLAAGVIYVSGLLGLEMVGGWYLEENGQPNFTLALISTAEEFMEMLGVVIFVYSLTAYLSLHVKDVRLSIGEEAPRPAVALQPVGAQQLP